MKGHRASDAAPSSVSANGLPRMLAGATLPVVLAVLAAGCTAQGSRIQTSSSERTVPLENAFILPGPGGPAVLGIVERRYSNGTQQEIALETRSNLPGQNVLRVRLYGPVERDIAGTSSLPLRRIGLTNIASEMRASFSGVSMQRSPYFVQNQYGPFGYAFGRGSGPDLCLYGWQNLRAPSAVLRNQGIVDIRLRVCEVGATEEQLLQLMYGYSVNAFFAGQPNWGPYGDPAPVAEGLGRAGAEMLPEADRGFETVLSAPAAVAPPPAAAPRIAAEPAPPVLPAPTGPRVPAPPAAALPAATMVPPPPSAATGIPAPVVVPPPPPPAMPDGR